MSLSGFAGALGSAVTASEPRSIEARTDLDAPEAPGAEPFSSSLARASAEHDGERRGTAEEIRSERPIKGGGISKDTRRNKQQLPEPPAPAPAAVRIELQGPPAVEPTSALTPLYSARLKNTASRSAETAPFLGEPATELSAGEQHGAAEQHGTGTGERAASSASPEAVAPPPSPNTEEAATTPAPSQPETAAPAHEEPAEEVAPLPTAAPRTETSVLDLVQAAVTLTPAPPAATSAPTSPVVAPAPTPLAAAELELGPDAELPRGRIGLIGTAITLGEGEQQITVAIRTDGRKVYLAASARSDDLLRILAQHRGELRQFLGQHGLVLESFSATASRHESSNGAEEPREGGGASEMATEDEGPPERRGRARVRVVL